LERNYFFYIAVILTIVITTGSLISYNRNPVIATHISDKSVHVFGYFLLTLSWLLTYKFKAKQLKFNVLISLIVFVYGIIIEALQGTLTNNRQLDFYDIFANLIGIIVAFVFFNIVFQKKLVN
jgi:VanZ family protein